MSKAPTLYTVKEVAEILCVSERNLRRMLDKRLIPFHRIGCQIRISETDLKTYLASTREGGNW